MTPGPVIARGELLVALYDPTPVAPTEAIITNADKNMLLMRISTLISFIFITSPMNVV